MRIKALQLTPRAWAPRSVVPFWRRGLGALAWPVSARGAAEGQIRWAASIGAVS